MAIKKAMVGEKVGDHWEHVEWESGVDQFADPDGNIIESTSGDVDTVNANAQIPGSPSGTYTLLTGLALYVDGTVHAYVNGVHLPKSQVVETGDNQTVEIKDGAGAALVLDDDATYGDTLDFTYIPQEATP